MATEQTTLLSGSGRRRNGSLLFQLGLLFAIALLSLFLITHPTSSSSHSRLPAPPNSPRFDHLHHSLQCPGLEPIGVEEFSARRRALGRLLRGPQGREWGAWISEPSPNTLYYTNLSTTSWSLSERPWLAAITPSTSSSSVSRSSSYLSILVPAFEKSRAQALPFALSKSDFEEISWVEWQEDQNPYDILVKHLSDLYEKDKEKVTGEMLEGSGWRIDLEENMRQFVSHGLEEAVNSLRASAEVLSHKEDVQIGFARIEVREQRMQKTEAELKILRCAARVTIEAIRSVRPLLHLGMTEKAGEDLIHQALLSAGLTSPDHIVLFGSNAALPHAEASENKILEEGEFILMDVGGSLMGYVSDFTRTMLPGKEAKDLNGGEEGNSKWPDERAKKVWETVREAQEAALDSLVTKREGGSGERDTVRAMDFDRAAREVITREGWGSRFSHRLGHGIGLQMHEHPYLNPGNPQILLPGEAFSNEPGIYIERSIDERLSTGHGIGVRLEDMVLKTEFGWELLSGSGLATSPWNI